ncbi:PASTA domain-containing protein [Mycolicibacterium aubagnense]|uniref:PASTA domain-containing protein n=1 Tax=Mycolicibacterium aubagnense TaxID=319707 RepID=UPI0013D437F8|nr:PASTA domain-containing protein [Mycolicibacterium aubagnense]WGI30911.1 PASTA domain-containing protein [Mycolicibacterium aubagnense]
MILSRTICLLAAASFATVTLTACGGSNSSAPSTVTASPSTVTVAPSTVTVAGPTPAASVAPAATVPAKSGITIPDIAAGTNAAIAKSKLEALGLTNVELSSANPDYSNVFLPKNWTVVSIEPTPGSQVQASDPVIVKVTKP